jgi:peroxiredoxin
MIRRRGHAQAAHSEGALLPGTPAPAFALHDSPHSQVTLEEFRGLAVVLVFYVADWQPVATAQLGLYQELLPHLARLDATVLGISIDGTWSHKEFARSLGLSFPLLSDDAPPGSVARAYGVDAEETGRSKRALFVIDRNGIVRWRATFPDAVNPGVDGVLSALGQLRPDDGSHMHTRNGLDASTCPCGCGLSSALVGHLGRNT